MAPGRVSCAAGWSSWGVRPGPQNPSKIDTQKRYRKRRPKTSKMEPRRDPKSAKIDKNRGLEAMLKENSEKFQNLPSPILKTERFAREGLQKTQNPRVAEKSSKSLQIWFKHGSKIVKKWSLEPCRKTHQKSQPRNAKNNPRRAPKWNPKSIKNQ